MLVDFSNGTKILDSEAHLPPTIIAGLRIAYSHFIKKKGFQMNFPEFFERVKADVKSFNLASVMRAIQMDLSTGKIFILLHLDGVQTLFEFESSYTYEVRIPTFALCQKI